MVRWVTGLMSMRLCGQVGRWSAEFDMRLCGQVGHWSAEFDAVWSGGSLV